MKQYSWTRTVTDYEPTGIPELRVGDYAYGSKLRDGKEHRLEAQLPKCVGAVMREGRSSLMSAKLAVQRAIERQQKERERAELARQIVEEEKKVKDLENWVTNWARAQQTRDFVASLERLWTQQGHAA